MIIKKIDCYTDSHLTKAHARQKLSNYEIVIAYYKNEKNAYSVTHSHPYHEIIIPVSGSEVRYSVDGGLYTVGIGDMAYFPAGTFHSGQFHMTQEVSERLVLQIDDSLWKRMEKRIAPLQLEWDKQFTMIQTDSVRYWDVKGLIERMNLSNELKEDFRKEVLCAQLTELVMVISQVMQTKEAVSQGMTNELVAKSSLYLQEHYRDSELTISKLAEQMYTSREHLSRAFREYTMESPHDYLTNLRMQYCRRRLEEGVSVMDACMESGFSNYTSFLKTFRQMYGISPSEYRKQKMIDSNSLLEYRK